MSKNSKVMKNHHEYPSFQELSDLREKIQKEIRDLDDSINEEHAMAFVDAEESSELYDLHTQITSIIGLQYLDELFCTIDTNSHTHKADFIEGLQGIINPTEDYDELFFIQLDEYEWDYEWNEQLQYVIKKLNAIPLDYRLELLNNLRNQILRRLDKAIEFWGKPKNRQEQTIIEPEEIIKFANHYLFLQSFENYDHSIIFTKQLRKYIKSRPFFPAITSEILFYEITRLSEISEANGFQEIVEWLGGIFQKFFVN